MVKKCLFKMAVMLVMGCQLLQAGVSYQVIDLGTLEGTGGSGANAINQSGQIVGAAHPAEGVQQATMFDRTGNSNNVPLGSLPYQGGNPPDWQLNDGRSYALHINNAGQIVGAADDGISTYATLFDSTGNGNNIQLSAQGTWSEAWCSDNGMIVGASDEFVGEFGQASYHATLFDASGNGNNINLGTLAAVDDDFSSIATHVNQSGQIVGLAQDSNYTTYHATLFDSTGNGNNISLESAESAAWCINDVGQVVGTSDTQSYYFPGGEYWMTGHEATLFDISGNGNNVILGTLGSEWQFSNAYSINNESLIVGTSMMVDMITDETIIHATLFDTSGSGNNLDLNDMIDSQLGWTLVHATGVNDNGWIVGTGYIDGNDEQRAFLLVPVPEPCTLSLLACGSLVLWRKRKRRN